VPSILKYPVLAVLIILLYPSAFAQYGNPDKAIEKAAQVLAKGDPYTALDILSEARRNAPDNMNLAYELAELCRLTRDYEGAANLYSEVAAAQPGTFPLAGFYHGLMLQQSGHYSRAIEVLGDAQRNYRGADRFALSQRAKDAISGSQLALEMQQKPTKTSVHHLGREINSAYTDLSPVWKNDSTMWYASLRIDTVVVYDPTLTRFRDYVGFYEARHRNGLWQFVGPVDGPFNHKKYDNGNGVFGPDGKSFYFTRCKAEGVRTLCKIYLSTYAGGKWSSPELLDAAINLEGYTATQPFITINPTNGAAVLLFVSDRPGGRGGLDIWSSQFDNRTKRWRNPSNLGRNVNTAGDEMTPFYDPEQEEFYFSSDGWPGLGGLDVFRTSGLPTRITSRPENMGLPINSPADDLYYKVNPSINKAFLVSNRMGGVALKNPTCCDDIYEVHLPGPIRIVLHGQVNTAQVNDPTATSPIHMATVILVDATTSDTLAADSTDTEGRYFFRLQPDRSYRVRAAHSEYLDNASDTVGTWGIEDDSTLFVPLLILTPITREAIAIPNVYYEFDSDALTEDSKATLDSTIFKLMSDNPTLQLEIRSHTDGKGTREYNMNLSNGRAKSVVDYLVSKGIDAGRLTSTGFGDTMPIAPNVNPDGSDNPEGRAKNRRTEFRITGLSREGLEINYE
jgi:OmpA-OmpF porin, OOP family